MLVAASLIAGCARDEGNKSEGGSPSYTGYDRYYMQGHVCMDRHLNRPEPNTQLCVQNQRYQLQPHTNLCIDRVTNQSVQYIMCQNQNQYAGGGYQPGYQQPYYGGYQPAYQQHYYGGGYQQPCRQYRTFGIFYYCIY